MTEDRYTHTLLIANSGGPLGWHARNYIEHAPFGLTIKVAPLSDTMVSGTQSRSVFSEGETE